SNTVSLLRDIPTFPIYCVQITDIPFPFQISRLEDLLASKTTALRELESKLEEQNNYEEIKRELSILKSVEFSTSEREGDEIKPESSPKSLEMLLLDKNKRLQSENTSLKVENVDLTGRYTELHSKYNEAVNTVKEQKELIGQLETDLLSVNALPSAFRGQGEGEAGPPTEKELVSNAVQQAVASGTGGLTGDNVESLLPIVASQRERFKVRNMELEAVGSPIGCTNFVSLLCVSFSVERYPIVCRHWE
ncbi:PREDICTED: protein CASP-like, partial [Acropora digitifera]|uniref:protein CASP-like n=1 Tax=Acropora digitifera TaxID=70779 RepID=UPI00077AC036